LNTLERNTLDIVAGVVPALADAKVYIAANEPGLPIHLVDASALADTLIARKGLKDLHEGLKAYEEKLLHHQIALPSKLATKLAAYSAKLKQAIKVEQPRSFLVTPGGMSLVDKINHELDANNRRSVKPNWSAKARSTPGA
jgi:hypothetical protein